MSRDRIEAVVFVIAMAGLVMGYAWNLLLGNIESAVARNPLTAVWVCFVAGAFIGWVLG